MIAKKYRNGKKNRDMEKIKPNGIRTAKVIQTSNGNGKEINT